MPTPCSSRPTNSSGTAPAATALTHLSTFEISDGVNTVSLPASTFTTVARSNMAPVLVGCAGSGDEPMFILNNVSASVGAVIKPAGFADAQGIISANYLKDPTDPQWKDSADMKAWNAWMDKYLPGADKSNSFYVYGYAVGWTMADVLKRAGNDLTREAHRLLKAAPVHFIGNVEGRDVYAGEADVIVCDGFVGNVALKASEGLATMLGGFIRVALREKLGLTPRHLEVFIAHVRYDVLHAISVMLVTSLHMRGEDDILAVKGEKDVMKTPVDVAVDVQNRIYVLDAGSSTVRITCSFEAPSVRAVCTSSSGTARMAETTTGSR